MYMSIYSLTIPTTDPQAVVALCNVGTLLMQLMSPVLANLHCGSYNYIIDLANLSSYTYLLQNISFNVNLLMKLGPMQFALAE